MLALVYSLHCSSETVIATFEIPQVVVKNKDGTYSGDIYLLAKRIFRKIDPKIKIIVVPPKRATHWFQSGKIAGFFPAIKGTVGKAPLYSDVFAKKIDYIYYREEMKASSLKELYGKRVGLTRGYPYDKSVIGIQKILWSKAHTDLANLKKLQAGRIDYFLCEAMTCNRALAKEKISGIGYDEKHPISVQKGYFAFQNTSTGKSLAKQLNRQLKAVIKSGEWTPNEFRYTPK